VLFPVNKAPFWLSKVLPSKGLKLGLDLQGGTHLVLSVDVDKVLLEHVDRNIERLNLDLKKENIVLDKIYRRDGSTLILVKAAKSSDEDKITSVIKKTTGMVFVTMSDGFMQFDIKPEEKEFRKKNALDQTIEAVRNRIDEFGVNEPSIQTQGDDRIVVQLPGVKDSARAKSIIGRTARLEFKLVRNDPGFSKEKLMMLVNKAKEAGLEYKEGTSYPDYMDKLNVFLAKSLPEGTMLLFEKKVDPNSGKKFYDPYLLEKVSMVTGDHLKDAYVTYSQDFGEPSVSFQMNAIGSKFMETLTGNNIGKQLAIVLDSNVYSAPVIQAKISDSGQITLGRGRPAAELQQEAEDIALVLRAGALPAQLVFEEERVVGPSLGSDSIAEGKLSFILGSVLVVLFMLIYYRFSGFIADLAVGLNVLLLAAVLVMFDATMTLPGIAGIILTVGMSVDANVLINERIREELRLGNAPRAALEMGYDRAFWTILDAHVTNVISGVVLLQYGTGSIKGFAVVLLIGIVFSLFTAVFATRWAFEFMMDKGWVKRMSI
jgi:protein-export membrane protein SecD